MDASRRCRPSRALVLAIAVSLGVHLAALPFLRTSSPARANEPAHVIALESPPSFRIDRTPPPRPPKPKPTPPPPRTARATPPPRTARTVAIAPPHASARTAHAPVESHSLRTSRTEDAPFVGEASGAPFVAAEPGSGTPAGVPQPQPPLPVPTPTDTPACAKAPRDASVLDAVTPERPAPADAQGATGHVEVRVDLTPSGGVASASIHRSSGNASLDSAALEAAQRATYVPASDGCKPVGGSYVYTVDYTE